MLEDEFFRTVHGEILGVCECGTEYIQLIELSISDPEQSINVITSHILPQEAMILADKLIRFANAAKQMQPALDIKNPPQNEQGA